MKQAKRKNSKKTSKISNKLKLVTREAGAILLFAVGVALFLALVSYKRTDPGWSTTGLSREPGNWVGSVGASVADILFSWFGYVSYLAPFMVIYAAWMIYVGARDSVEFNANAVGIRIIGFLITLFAGCGIASMHFSPGSLPVDAGGILGNVFGEFFRNNLGGIGGSLLLLAFFLAGITLFSNLSWLRVIESIGAFTLGLYEGSVTAITNWRDNRKGRAALAERKTAVSQVKAKVAKRAAPKPKIEPRLKPQPKSDRTIRERQIQMFKPPPGKSDLPPIDLLDEPPEQTESYSEQELEAISRQLELKLLDFNVEANVTEVHPGPVVTRFELDLAAGTKASKVTNLAQDLARALAVISVRVVEVIPGKSTIGVEIPNEKRELVTLSDVLAAPLFDKSKSPLTLALGKNISGEAVIADVAKMPHLLVAGTTGSGKSVAVNAMLISILFKAKADEVRLILIDPKMLELNVYEDIPHLLTPVVTDMKDASNALRWCVAEMERRYKLMSQLGVRNIAGYNKVVNEAIKKGKPIKDPLWVANELIEDDEAPDLESLPKIVVIVDEFADMMMSVGKKVEELIARLAQKARAAGIHLILATQRPSVDVITGLIKANIPTRMAFQVSSKVDSRTILDAGGAEQLLGHGDMLYLPPGTNLTERVHGAFIDDHEVHAVVDYLKTQGEPNYIEDVIEPPAAGAPAIPGLDMGGSSDDELDPLYDEAIMIVTETRKASISYLQRRLKVGYNRAARMIEAMESAGVVSGVLPNGSREVIAAAPPEH